MSTKLCVRYLLRDPITPRRLDAPRPAVYVTLEADGPDERGTVEFGGQDNSVAYVRTALEELLSSGLYGRLLSELPTPRNLVVVMDRPLIQQQYNPVCVMGLQLFQEAETARSKTMTAWSRTIALLLAETVPTLPAFDPYGRSALIERIDLLVVQGRALVDELPLPEDALAQAAAEVWRALGEAGKDAGWLRKAVSEGASVLDISQLQAPQHGHQAAAVIRHLAEALNAPERSTLPALVAQLEVDWAVGSPA